MTTSACFGAYASPIPTLPCPTNLRHALPAASFLVTPLSTRDIDVLISPLAKVSSLVTLILMRNFFPSQKTHQNPQPPQPQRIPNLPHSFCRSTLSSPRHLPHTGLRHPLRDQRPLPIRPSTHLPPRAPVPAHPPALEANRPNNHPTHAPGRPHPCNQQRPHPP